VVAPIEIKDLSGPANEIIVLLRQAEQLIAQGQKTAAQSLGRLASNKFESLHEEWLSLIQRFGNDLPQMRINNVAMQAVSTAIERHARGEKI
jgi:hypothetical protein